MSQYFIVVVQKDSNIPFVFSSERALKKWMKDTANQFMEWLDREGNLVRSRYTIEPIDEEQRGAEYSEYEVHYNVVKNPSRSNKW